MKFKLLTLLCVAAIPVMSAAATTNTTKTPPPPPAPYKMDDTTLGHLDAALGLCAKADLANLQTYLRHRAAFIPVLSVLSKDYKAAFLAVMEATEKATAAELKKQCSQSFGA